jgi:hypothetical protein
MKNTKILLSNSEISKIKNSKRLTKLERNSFVLTNDLKDILVGLALGDLSIRTFPKGKNAYLQFEQGAVHKDYLLHLYDLFKDYCSSGPKISNRKKDPITNKVYSRITFFTCCLPCFNFYYDLFYKAGKKILPPTIDQLLTARGLAF